MAHPQQLVLPGPEIMSALLRAGNAGRASKQRLDAPGSLSQESPSPESIAA